MKNWSSLATIQLKALMKRKKKDTSQENSVEKLLKPIKYLDFDFDESDGASEISDVFDEFHQNSYLRPQNKKYLTKHEADIKTIEEFTGNFKNTMVKLRQDLQLGPQLFLENIADIPEIFNNPKTPEIFPKISINKEITDMINDSTDSIPPPQDLKNLRKISDTSSTSIVWQLLAANSDENKFEITPPGFNTFRQNQPHWLQRASVSWNEIDQAKLKCETWLQTQFQ